MIKLKCEICSKEFTRTNSHHNSNIKKGIGSFCGNSCAAKSKIGSNYKRTKRGRYEVDEYSPFRMMLGSAKGHAKTKNRDFNITLKYLKELWITQNGICPYTGWKMILRPTKNEQIILSPERASLDRIDSSKGYIEGNVQFVSWMAQLAKNKYSSEELYKFCKAVVDNKEL